MAPREQMRWLQRAGCLAGLGYLLVPFCAAATPATRAASTRRLQPQTPWEQAERTREELEAALEPDRTRAEYTRALDAYRAIYHAHPQDLHAAAAVYAVAELLEEQGRELHDPGSLQAAIGQYEFLRKQYPGSSLRVQALLAEGQIAQIDLHDDASAKDRYQLLLRQYPRSSQAEEARAALDSLTPATPGAPFMPQSHRGMGGVERSPTQQEPPASPTPGAPFMPQSHRGMGGVERSSTQQEPPASPAPDAPFMPQSHRGMGGVEGPSTQQNSALIDAETRPEITDTNSPRRIGKRAVVTGIRHWSTTTYTRIAIDLGDSVTYEAARVPNPDRIYFDLHGTRLASELVGKSFTVTDDGFLKKIRAAQFSDEMTRVVLDVNDVTEYSAFLLPNPYRLIIDIHGRQNPPATQQAHAGGVEPRSNPQEPAATSSSSAPFMPQSHRGMGGVEPSSIPTTVSSIDVPAPHTAGIVSSTPARPVPNTLTTRQISTAEVAAISDSPGKVEATTLPTSQPISAVVQSPTSSAPAPSQTTSDSAIDQPAGVSIAQAPASAYVPGSTPIRKSRKAAASSSQTLASKASPARAAAPTADGETSLVRALGLKIGRIVIDAGHGGHDSGTLGVDGLEEKDVVLDVALRVGKLLHDRLGAEVVYTRSDDTFIPLESRTAIANKAQADLFLSIHANSSSDESARGVETYYLNFTSDPSAIETAARENAVSDQSIHQLSDLVKKIALKDKIAESREFASDVETSLYSGLARGNAGLKDRGVKKAPFVVLIGANMPSILAEISFVTNPRDAEQLREPDYRQRIAESLYRGVARYEGGLSTTRAPAERASAAP